MRLVVVDVYVGVVIIGFIVVNRSNVKIGLGWDRFENGVFGVGVKVSLLGLCVSIEVLENL